MEGQSGLSELSVISWVSAFQGVSVKRGSTVFFNTEALVTFADIRMLLSGRRVALCAATEYNYCVLWSRRTCLLNKISLSSTVAL